MYTELTLTPKINGLNILVRHYGTVALYIINDRRGGFRCTARSWDAALKALSQCLAIDSGKGLAALAGYQKALASLADISTLETYANLEI